MRRTLGFLVFLLLPVTLGTYPRLPVHASALAAPSPIAGSDVYGTVVLADGSRVPGVQVTVERNGKKFTTISGDRGNFRFLRLAPGEYKVTFELEGFKTVERRGVVLRGGGSRTLNVLLETTTLKEELVVTGDAPSALGSSRAVSRGTGARGSSGSPSTTISREMLEELPTARDPWSVLQTVPGVHLASGSGTTSMPATSKVDEILEPLEAANNGLVDGLKNDLNAATGKDAKLAVLRKASEELQGIKAGAEKFGNASLLRSDTFDQAEQAIKQLQDYFNSSAYNPAQEQPGFSQVNIRGSLDGVGTSFEYGLDPYGTDPLLGITLRDVDAVGGVTAEYGRFTGGVINAITKSGGNEFSGSLRVNLNNDDWGETPGAGSSSGGNNYGVNTQGGIALGGPILKDRLWYFTNYESRGSSRNPFFVNNQTSKSSYTINVGGQTITVEPGTWTSFNPDRADFSGFFSSQAGGGAADAPTAGQIYGDLFYPRSTPNSFSSGYGGTVFINPDFIERSLLNNWGGFTTGVAGQGVDERARGSLEYLFDTSWGDHALKLGFESGTLAQDSRYTGILSPSQFRLLQIPGSAGADTGGTTPQVGSGSSLYVNDRWQLNDKWSFNIGVRYDEPGGSDTTAPDDVSNFTPRLGLSYDIRGDGRYSADLTYAQYAGKYSQPGTATTGSGNWDGTFDFDAGGRGLIIPSGGRSLKAFFHANKVRLALNDSFIFNRGPITTYGYYGLGTGGAGLFNNNVSIKFEYTGSCSELLTERDLEELVEDYKDYLYWEFDEYYPTGPGTCGGRVRIDTYRDEFVFLMQNDEDFRYFFEDWERGLLPLKWRVLTKYIEPRVQLIPTAPSRDAGVLPDDAFYQSSGSAQKKVDDQWGLKRIGFQPAGRDGKGAIWPRQGTPTIVAVVDSGVDLTHPELQGQLWANFAEIPDNGKDDDGNGLVDDVFGWNFEAFNNDVSDMYGHGTFIAGIIGAATDNGIGIAGINPWARIMPVRVSTYHGRSNNIRVAQGIYYAAEMGARVINVSFEGDIVSKVIQSAVDHAVAKGALVVVAAGNRGIDVAGVSPAVIRGALTVAATGPSGEHEKYSNHGTAVDIAAPGTHIISLRASRTDLMQFEDPDYEPGGNILGESGLLYHLSGTSFAAPHVAGVASLLFSMNPELTAEQVRRMILQSARDVGVAGTDRLTGYGELDAAAALQADPDFYVEAVIDGVEVAGAALRVLGTATADRLKSAWVELGKGEEPTSWKVVGEKVKKPVTGGALTEIDVNELRGASTWTLQLVVEHKDGTRRVNRYVLQLG